jgi:hypothetical protein
LTERVIFVIVVGLFLACVLSHYFSANCEYDKEQTYVFYQFVQTRETSRPKVEVD